MRDDKLAEIRDSINEYQTRAIKLIKELGDDFTFSEFEYRFVGKLPPEKKNKLDVYLAFEEYMAILEKQKKYSTKNTYRDAMRSLRTFREKLEFSDITVSFLEEFEAVKVEGGMSKATIGIYLRNLRTLFNRARFIDKVIPVDMYPFGPKSKGLYQIPVGSNKKTALTEEEMRVILQWDPDLETNRINIHLFQFSLLCNGMNMADVFNLKNENIIGDFIVFDRVKTVNSRKSPEPIEILITPPIRKIIERWGTKEKNPDAFIFPVYKQGMTEKQMFNVKNDKIKMINQSMRYLAMRLGIDRGITTYVARHTWASVMNAENINILEISKGLGHTSISTTQNYLKSFNMKAKEQMAGAFDKILKSQENESKPIKRKTTIKRSM